MDEARAWPGPGSEPNQLLPQLSRFNLSSNFPNTYGLGLPTEFDIEPNFPIDSQPTKGVI